ncbi:hypothetical protein AB6A40_011009 [Gnathostoma spinigerum]|uniref:Uncharacterized protein n=1 Tax=Gnathostoma spinigerum TaxID=75299 RepID=A0ABD6F472_9BILA
MARVHCVDNEVIVCAKDIVAVLSSSFDKGKIELNLKKLLKVTNVGASADRDCLEKEGTVEGDENGKSGGTEKIVEVVNSTLSKDGSLFGVALTNKTCIVYDRLNDWSERLPHFIFSKCPTSLVFDAENYNLLIADRAGNVFHRHLKSNAPLCDRCDHCGKFMGACSH